MNVLVAGATGAIGRPLISALVSARHNGVCKPDALLLDDLGTENPTPFARETVALVIDRAYRNKKVIIVTSNYDLESLAEKLGARSVDRLIEICLAVKLTGPSYRQKQAARRASNRNSRTSEVVQ
jgi:DNA replication protein DnaC